VVEWWSVGVVEVKIWSIGVMEYWSDGVGSISDFGIWIADLKSTA